MTIKRARMYIRYSTACPDDVHPARWNAILKYLQLNED